MDLIDRNMCPIPIRDLLAGVKVPVDLHVRLGENKYVAVLKAGSYTQVDRFLSYENKQIDTFWVRREDYQLFVGQCVAIAKELSKQRGLSTSQKSTILAQAASSVLGEIKDIGVSKETYEHARQVTEATLQVVESNFDLLSALQSMGIQTQGSLNHAVAVSMVSVLIAKNQGWQKPGTLEKLALGGLLHDIGKRELPPELLEKTRAQMDFQEIMLFETHPFRGMELLRSISIVPDDVLSIVYEHHENAIGQGYPRRLKDLRINPLARPVALANQFVELVMPEHTTTTAKTPDDAVEHIEITMGQPYNKEAFRALKTLVKRTKAAS